MHGVAWHGGITLEVLRSAGSCSEPARCGKIQNAWTLSRNAPEGCCSLHYNDRQGELSLATLSKHCNNRQGGLW